MASAPAAENSYDAIPASRRLLAGIILALSNFMVVLDLTIANVSIPHIAGSMGITLEQGAWIITSYAVAEAIIVPITGWLALRFGTVRVFIAAMVGFGIFSFLCGISMTLGMIVAARIGQGLCGGPIMPMSQTLMLRVFPPQQRAAAMGLWAMTVILGPALGPVLGGYISETWSWHWVFFINVPIAAACVAVAALLLRRAETELQPAPLDRGGLFLLILWIGALQLMLDLGRDHDWFGDPLIVILAIIAGIGFLVFLIWELTEEHPIVNLRILNNRGLSASLLAMSFGFGSFFASLVIVPQWLQTAMGYSADKAGIVLGLQSLVSILFAPIVARLIQSVDSRYLLSGGMLWMAATTWLRSHWTGQVGMWDLTWPLMLQGIAVPFMMVPLTNLALGSVPPSQTTSAAGMQNFVRTMSIAIATATVLTLWSDWQRAIRVGMVDRLQADGAVSGMTQSGLSDEQARQMVSMMVDQQALVLSMNQLFQWSSALLVLSAAIVWLIPKTNARMDMSAAH